MALSDPEAAPDHGPHGHSWKTLLALVALGLVVLALLLVIGEDQPGQPLGTTAPFQFKGAATVTVVWNDRDGAPRTTLVEAERWTTFLAGMAEERAAFRARLTADGRKELDVAMAPVFDEMRARVKDYLNWYFSFFTSYRFFFTVAANTVKNTSSNWFGNFGDEARRSVAAFYGDQFARLVIRPEVFERALIASVVRVLSRAQDRQRLFDQDRERRMVAFLTANGRPVTMPVAGTPMVIGRDALGWSRDLPSLDSMEPVPTVGMDDVLSQLKTHGDTDSLVAFSRQGLRQGTRALVTSALVAGAGMVVAGGDVMLRQGLAGWVVGGVGYATGFGGEIALLKVLEFYNRDQLEAEAREVVDGLRERQLALINAGIDRRIALLFGN